MKPLVATVTWISLKPLEAVLKLKVFVSLRICEVLRRRWICRLTGAEFCSSDQDRWDWTTGNRTIGSLVPRGNTGCVQLQGTNCIPYAMTLVRLLIISAPKIRLFITGAARNVTEEETEGRSGPVWSGPVRCDPVRSGVIRSDPVRSSPVRSGPVRSGPVRCGPVRSGPVRCGPEKESPENVWVV